MVTIKKIQEQLTKNLLIPIVLDLLNNHPMCGYEIMLTIRKTYGVNLGASTLYPLLNNLDSRNLVTNEWEIDSRRPKKVYKLTQQGQNELNYSVSSLSQICKTLSNYSKTDKSIRLGIIIR